jgi:hypothetical protein
MNFLATLLLGAGVALLIGAGVLSLIQVLLGRGPHAAPLIEDDGLSWPPRYQGIAKSSQSAPASDLDLPRNLDHPLRR